MIYPIFLSSDRFSDREKRFRFLFRLGKTKIQSMVSGLKRIKSYESASRAPQVGGRYILISYKDFIYTQHEPAKIEITYIRASVQATSIWTTLAASETRRTSASVTTAAPTAASTAAWTARSPASSARLFASLTSY